MWVGKGCIRKQAEHASGSKLVDSTPLASRPFPALTPFSDVLWCVSETNPLLPSLLLVHSTRKVTRTGWMAYRIYGQMDTQVL